MTLLQKVNKEFQKVNLAFIQTKELNDKYKGILKDTKTEIEIPYDIPKLLQYDKVNSFAKMSRDLMNMHIKYQEMIK